MIATFIQRRNVGGLREDRGGGDKEKKICLKDTMKLGLRCYLTEAGQAERGIRNSINIEIFIQ